MENRLGFVQLKGKRRLVFGLEWVPLDDVLSRHEQIQVWRERGYQWCVSYTHAKQTQLGLATAEDALEGVADKGLAISAAALLAKLPGIKGGTGLYLLCTQADQASVYAIGLIKGRIIFDRVLTERDVVSVRSDYQSECARANVPPVIVGVEGQEQITGQLDHCISWDALIEARKGLKPATLQTLKSERTGWILVGVATTVLAVTAAAWLWREHNEQLRKKQLALQAWAADPSVLYQQSVQAFLGNPKAMTPLRGALEQLVPVLGKLQSQRGGWQLEGVICQMSDDFCTAAWGMQEGKLGTFASFKEASPALPADWQLNLGADMDKLQVRMPIVPIRAPAPQKQQLPSLQEFLAMQTWQNYAVLGVQVTMQAPMPQQVPANVPTPVAQNAADGLWASTWMVTGAPWWAVDALKPKSEIDGANVTLDKIALSVMGKEIKFSAEGKVYVRKP